MVALPSTAHSEIGASSAERWIKCPGSIRQAKTVPPPEPSKAAATGTVVHLLGEEYMRDIQGDPVPDYMPLDEQEGVSYVVDGFEIPVTDKMIEDAKMYMATVDIYRQRYNIQWKDVKLENKFDLTHIDPEAFGTCDVFMHSPYNKLIIMDYKNGYNFVDVVDNFQLKYYGLGAYYSLPKEWREELAYLETVIIQPNCSCEEGPVRSYTYTIEELLEFEKELTAAIKKVRDPNAPLNAGEHCKYCPSKAVCTAFQNQIETEAELAFGDIKNEPINLPEIESLSSEQLGRLMKNASKLSEFARDIISLCTVYAGQGEQVDGYKMVEKFGNRRWTDEKAVIQKYKDEFDDKIFNKKLKSPAQMEKLLKKARKEELEPYWEKPVTGTSLVPLDDERDAVGTGVENAFEPFV